MVEIKSTQERQTEILDAAEQLFALEGYDGTSVSDIMKVVGIAKGTLYYHFASKDEILDALISRIVDGMEQRARKESERPNLCVIERLVAVILSLSVRTHGNKNILSTLHQPQNALFHEKSHKAVVDRISPIMLKLVKEGMEDGIFCLDYPESAVHIAMVYSMTVFDEQPDREQIVGFIDNVEKMLGAEKGSLAKFLTCF